MHKFTVLLLVTCLIVSNLIVFAVPSVAAQAGFKPSVPQFTVKLVDDSYDVPPSSTTIVDQYTGKETTTTVPGYHVDQKFIEVTIKNQPFTSYTNENNKEINLYYTVQVKGHFGEDWQTFGHVQHFGSSTHVSSSPYTVQSDSGYTVVTSIANYATGSQLDFKAQAVTGYLYNSNADRLIPPWHLVSAEASSDWSNIQIFTIPDSPTVSVSPSQTTTLPPTPSDDTGQQQFPDKTQSPNVIFTKPFFLIGVGTLLVGVVIAVVLLILRRQTKIPIYTNDSTQNSANVELSLKRFSPPSTILARCECFEF